MKITFYGHSCFGIEVAGKHLLFDPFVSPNELAKEVLVDSIPADYILLSHGHEDHVADAASIAKRTGAKIISNFEIVTWYGKQGLDNGHPMNIGGCWEFDFGTVHSVNAIHSSMLPDGSFGGPAGGFVIDTAEGCFYYAGDTGLHLDMQLIARKHKLDFAMLPIGDNFTMGVDDAVVAAEFVNCKKIVAMHFDTFGFIVADKEAAKAKFAESGCELIVMDIGSTKDI